MADPVAFKYRAFLSYSHRDKASAERLAESDPANVEWQQIVAMVSAILGNTLRQLGRTSEAVSEFRKGRAIMPRWLKQRPI